MLMEWIKKFGVGVVATLLVLVLTSGALAATLVVDGRAVNADDANPGTRAQPLKTIGAAAQRVKPGDAVLVRPGVYREAVHLTVSGTEARPITFRSEVPRAAVIDGADLVTEFRPEGPGIWSFAAPGIAPLGHDAAAGDWTPAEQVYINDAPLERVTEAVRLTPGTFLLDYSRHRVLIAPAEGQRPGAAQVAFTVRDGLIAAEKPISDIHVSGFTLIHNNDWFGSLHALTICGRRWQVEDNRILWSSYAGMAFRHSNYCLVRHNTVDWSGAEDVVGNTTANLRFEGNRLLHGNWRRQAPDFEGGALKMVSTYDSLFRDNEAADFNGFGLWFDIGCGDNVFQRNVVHDSVHGAALFAEISWRVRYEDNIIYDNDFGLQVGESSECALTHNIVFNNDWGVYMRDDGHRKTATEYGRQSAEDYRQRLLADIPGLAPARAQRLSEDYAKYWVLPENFQVAYSDFSDNLVFGNGIGYTEHRHYGQPSDLATAIHDNRSDHNLFWSFSPDSLFGYESGNYASLADWQRATGRDLHSVCADPHAASTPLPEWARARRKLWDLKLRPRGEINALDLGLVRSPSAAEAMGRLTRAASLQRVDVGDPAVRAFVYESAGRRTLVFWTTQVDQRRPLRLDVGVSSVVVEDGYGSAVPQRLADAILPLTVGFIPTYVHGVGQTVGPAR